MCPRALCSRCRCVGLRTDICCELGRGLLGVISGSQQDHLTSFTSGSTGWHDARCPPSPATPGLSGAGVPGLGEGCGGWGARVHVGRRGVLVQPWVVLPQTPHHVGGPAQTIWPLDPKPNTAPPSFPSRAAWKVGSKGQGSPGPSASRRWVLTPWPHTSAGGTGAGVTPGWPPLLLSFLKVRK